MTVLTIGQVARQAGVGVETVRYYERQGLLEQPARKASGYRQYAADAVSRLRFIRRGKELGFSLKEIGELLALRFGPDATVAEVKRRAEAKIADIEGKIRDLQRTRDALRKLATPVRDRARWTNARSWRRWSKRGESTHECEYRSDARPAREKARPRPAPRGPGDGRRGPRLRHDGGPGRRGLRRPRRPHLLLLLSVLCGKVPGRSRPATPAGAAASARAGGRRAGAVYTCPMHPEVRQDHPGACPKCGMALEPAGGAAPDDQGGIHLPDAPARSCATSRAAAPLRHGPGAAHRHARRKARTPNWWT